MGKYTFDLVLSIIRWGGLSMRERRRRFTGGCRWLKVRLSIINASNQYNNHGQWDEVKR